MPPANHPNHPAPTAPANPAPGGHEPAGKGPTSDKSLMIRIGIVAGVVLIILIIVLVAASGGSKKNNNSPANPIDENQGPQPATPLIIDQANNSISQDIASLHDDTDFPVNALEDDSLSL